MATTGPYRWFESRWLTMAGYEHHLLGLPGRYVSAALAI